MDKNKKWSIALLVLLLVTLLGCCAITIVIDPFFHYHAPMDSLQYPITKERYQNDGIVRHFSYDAILTGTSMTENFKASECDALFGVNSVKTCFNGSSLLEISQHIERAVDVNPELKLVIRGYDGWNLFEEATVNNAIDPIPDYLYDQNIFNDVSYLLNKTILLQDTIGVLKHTLKGNATTTFDEYGRWHQHASFGADVVKSGYVRPETSAPQAEWTESQAAVLSESLEVNAINIARENPQIQFYYFFTPYSILYMDMQYRQGILQQQFSAYTQATQEMLETENIHVFSFFDDYDTITNLDNYYDPAHYHEDINALILQRMAYGQHELTTENYQSHWETVAQYYLSYPYDGLFQ